MKRLLTLFLSVLMLWMVISSAVAEQTVTIYSQPGRLQVTMTLKDGDTVQQLETDAESITRLIVTRQGCADITVSVAYADLDEDGSLADLDEDSLQQIESEIREEYPSGTIKRLTTNSGNLYLYTDAGEYDLHDVFTLYHGYFIELVQYRDGFAPLTGEDEAFLTEVFQGIWTK